MDSELTTPSRPGASGLLLRAGITGLALGLLHVAILAAVGLYRESDFAQIVTGALRYASWFCVLGVGLGAFFWVALRWLPIRSLGVRRGLASVYLLVWTAFLLKQASSRGAGGILEGTLVGVVAVAVSASGLRWRSSLPPHGGLGQRLAAILLLAIALGCALGLPGVLGPTRGESVHDLTGWTLEPFREAARDPFAPGGWNVLLLSFDTTRADHLGCYGYPRPTSAALDSIAAVGVRFGTAIVQRPKTSPNVATMLTGTYPATHGIHQAMRALPEASLTLAEILSEAGWQTGAVVTNGNLYPEFHFDQGFADYEYGHKNAREGADKALAWLDGRDGESPWLLWVHATDPHWPYDPPEPWRSRLARAGASEREDAVDRYDAEIAFADHETGRLLDWVRARPEIASRTLIIFTADHGESLGEHDYSYEHGLLAYEPSARVPLLFAFSGKIPRGEVRDAVVSSVDLVPTILDVLHLPVPDVIQGRSIVPLMMGMAEAGPRDFAYFEAGYGEHIGAGRLRALRTRTHKYIRRLKEWALSPGLADLIWTFDSALEGGLAADEVYDLRSDPEELNSLGPHPHLRATVDAFHRQLGEHVVGARSPGELDKETEASLRSLGYIE